MVRRGACHESPTTALQNTAVLQSISLYHKVPLRSTKYYCAPSKFDKVLYTLYNKVLQSTTPYYTVQNTSLYYQVFLRTSKFYKVLLRTTESITPQKALQSTYKVQQSSTPRHMKRPIHCGGQPMVCKTQGNYDFHARLSQHMKRPVHCAEQPMGCRTQWNYDVHTWCRNT